MHLGEDTRFLMSPRYHLLPYRFFSHLYSTPPWLNFRLRWKTANGLPSTTPSGRWEPGLRTPGIWSLEEKNLMVPDLKTDALWGHHMHGTHGRPQEGTPQRRNKGAMFKNQPREMRRLVVSPNPQEQRADEGGGGTGKDTQTSLPSASICLHRDSDFMTRSCPRVRNVHRPHKNLLINCKLDFTISKACSNCI